MSVNIQQADKTLKKVADTTVVNKSTIEGALKYTPASTDQLNTAKTDLTNSIDEVSSNLSTTANNLQAQINALEGSAFDGDYNKLKNAPIENTNDGKAVFADPNGNIIARIDASGITTTEVTANNINTNDNKLEFADADGNYIARIDSEGLTSTDLTLTNLKNEKISGIINDLDARITAVNNQVIDLPIQTEDLDDSVRFVDKEDNIIAQIDKDGVHSTDYLVGNGTKEYSLVDLVNDIPVASVNHMTVIGDSDPVSTDPADTMFAILKKEGVYANDFFYDKKTSIKETVSGLDARITAASNTANQNATAIGSLTDIPGEFSKVRKEFADADKVVTENYQAADLALKNTFEEADKKINDTLQDNFGDLSQEADSLQITDKEDNIIAQFDSEGLTATQINLKALGTNPSVGINVPMTLNENLQTEELIGVVEDLYKDVAKIPNDYATKAELTALNNNINTLESFKADLIDESKDIAGTVDGKTTYKSIREIATEELTSLLVPEDAKESLDTLQEISAWIQDHPDDAAAMNSNINELAESLEGYITIGENGNITSTSTIKSAITALNNSTSTNSDNIEKIKDKIGLPDLDTTFPHGSIYEAINNFDSVLNLEDNSIFQIVDGQDKIFMQVDSEDGLSVGKIKLVNNSSDENKDSVTLIAPIEGKEQNLIEYTEGIKAATTAIQNTVGSSTDTADKNTIYGAIAKEIARATAAEEAAVTSANSYTDGKVGSEAAAREAAITAESNARTAAISAETTARNTAIEEATVFETDILTVNALGGIKAGEDLNGKSVTEILNKLLYPYVAPVVSKATRTPTTSVLEQGTTLYLTKVAVEVTKKSLNITSIGLYNGSTLIEEITGENLTGCEFTNLPSYTTSVSKLTVKASDGTSTATKDISGWTFVYPYYYGVCAEGATIDETLVKGLANKLVETKGNKSKSFTTNNECFVFAYPATYTDLTSVLDPNNFEILGTFNKHTFTITGLDGKATSYKIYVSKAPSTVTDFQITFKH